MKSNYCFILIIILIFASCNKKAETTDSNNDSVEKYLKLVSIDTLPFEARKMYNQKAFSFIDLEKNDTVVRWYLCEVALNNQNLKDSINYKKIAEIHFSKSKEKKDSLNIARYYRYLGAFFSYEKHESDSALYFYNQSQKYYSNTSKRDELGIIYLNKGYCYSDFSDYAASELSHKLALKIFKEKKDYLKIRVVFSSLGNVKHNMKMYSEAINYHSEALKILKKLRQSQKESVIIEMEMNSYNNIGNSFREMSKYSRALYYFNKGLALNKEENEIKAYLYNNLGYCHLKQNKFDQLPNAFEKAKRIFDSLKIKNEAAISRIYLAEYYIKIKDSSKAKLYAAEAVKLSKSSKSSYYYLYCLSHAGSIIKQKASGYIAEYHKVNDSVVFEERKARNQYFKIQLETDEITQEKEKAIKQKWVQTSAVSGILIIVILLFVIYKQRNQKKEFLLLQHQKNANEEIYQLMLNQHSKEEEARQNEKKRIGLELHDNVMNQLASTRFNLFSLTQGNNDKKIAKEHIDKIKEVEDEIRNLTHELVSENFTNDNSFKQLIKQFINQQNQLHSTDFKLIMNSNINWDSISSEIKMNLYRIIQEAVHNSNKHSEATKVVVQFSYQNSQLDLIIRDNGIGFDQNEIHQGIGLQNMQQRMESINGKLFISSVLRKGTLITCSVSI